MVKCPNCSNDLVQKIGTLKFSAQIGNPEIAIVETVDPKFCQTCNECYVSAQQMSSAIKQIKNAGTPKVIPVGIYS